jgi:hypothetical protein
MAYHVLNIYLQCFNNIMIFYVSYCYEQNHKSIQRYNEINSEIF